MLFTRAFATGRAVNERIHMASRAPSSMPAVVPERLRAILIPSELWGLSFCQNRGSTLRIASPRRNERRSARCQARRDHHLERC
jgi:hypothetical protein